MKVAVQRNTIAALIMVACMLATACSALRPGPAATVEKFYRLLEKGEITEASKLISVSITSQYGEKLKMGLAEQVDEIQKNKGITTMAVQSEVVTGEMATVVIDITFGNGTKKSDTNKLRREDGQWRIGSNK